MKFLLKTIICLLGVSLDDIDDEQLAGIDDDEIEDLNFNSFMDDDRHNFFGDDDDDENDEDGCDQDGMDDGGRAPKRFRSGKARDKKGKRRNVEVEYEGNAERMREREELTQR